MAGLAPRTVVGLGRGGQLVFVVAEGRIPDGPAGLSGEMMGSLLVEMGLVEAAMLDGGASSQMLMGDTVVNRLSAGRERLLSSGFVLLSVSADAGEGNIQH
jgi:exopolysaccharide biosynthesis protein